MKPFQFTLQSVLDYRSDLEAEAALKFQKTQQEVLVFEQVLEELTTELNKLAEYLANQAQLTSQELQQSSRYRSHLGEQILVQRQNLAYANRKRELAHQAWMKARQEVQVMERLRDKQQDSYQKEMERQEAKQMEEYAMMLRHRNERMGI